EGMTPSQGISAVATLGYTGFLVGPVIIGWLAEYFGLQMGFVLLMVLSALAIFYAPRAFSFQVLRKG
ncbi:MAG: MFS transporter, partial [Bacteroidetes bacterium]|nr:MFS transporter [Bacteroidota bacterium]